jgi:hypothetical protein
VAGSRFAPHLEKCLRGGKRGSRKSNFTEISLPYSNAPKIKLKIVDPLPKSMIVRVKMRNGGTIYSNSIVCYHHSSLFNIEPKSKQIRLGVSLEEFEKYQKQSDINESNETSCTTITLS